MPWFGGWLSEPFERFIEWAWLPDEVYFWLYIGVGLLKFLFIFRFWRIRAVLKDTLFQSYIGCLGLFISLHLFFFTLYITVALISSIDVGKYVFLRPFDGHVELISLIMDYIFYSSLKADRLSFIFTTTIYLIISMCTSRTSNAINSILVSPFIFSSFAMLLMNLYDTIIASDYFFNIPLMVATLSCFSVLLLNICSAILPIAPFDRYPSGRRVFGLVFPLLVLHFKLIQVAWFASERWIFGKWSGFYEYVDDSQGDYERLYYEQGWLVKEFCSPIRSHSVYSFQLLPLLTILWIFVVVPEYRRGIFNRKSAIHPDDCYAQPNAPHLT